LPPLSRRRFAAAFAGLAGLLLLPSLAGSAPTGRFDVGGYKLFINCTGKGSPTVVLDIGLGGDGAVWFTVQRSAAKTLRVCSYDRAGRFRSDPRPSSEPAPIKLLVQELHVLLANAHVPPPYVLVGHSLGGLTMRYYTKTFPDEVVGLVMVDSSYEGQFTFGSPIASSRGEVVDAGEASEELLKSDDLGNRALVVVEHGIPFGPDDLGGQAPVPGIEIVWRAYQKRIAQMSTNSRLVIAKYAGHGIPRAQPRIIVVAIRQVVAAVRQKAKLPSCKKTFARIGGRCLAVRP
jgi:alpha/beta hydrolase fold